MQRETPSIHASAYTAAVYRPDANIVGGLGIQNDWQADRRIFQAAANQAPLHPLSAIKQENTPVANSGRRLIQVFIADPDENVPLDDCLLFKGEPKLTDLTDQELFFEVDIKSILDKHNEKRVKLVNKKVKERVENLEPAKIRDLKMVVVNVAQF